MVLGFWCWTGNMSTPDLVTVYPKKYAHGFVVLCFVMVMESFIMNSHEVFIHIHQGCFAGTGAIVRLPQCQWSKPDGYGKISQCITTTKHSKAKTVCIFLGIYCISAGLVQESQSSIPNALELHLPCTNPSILVSTRLSISGKNRRGPIQLFSLRTKWTPFHRRYFQMRFCYWKFFILIEIYSLQFSWQ